jgi:tripartite-type tricarboxylate transporter receptor subunit TctC
MFSAPVAIGRPFLTSPGIPAERAAALRKAFDAVMADPQFREEGEKLKLDINPTSGPQLAKIISELVNTPPDIVARARKVSR